MNEILKVENLQKTYKISKMFKAPQLVYAVQGVSFALNQGETLAVVGESGCGKSTLAKALVKIEEPTGGQILLKDKNIASYKKQELSNVVQMIFQDPYSSLNPRKNIKSILSEPLVVQGSHSSAEINDRVLEVIKKVGIREDYLTRYPHMFSGGQRQRIGIARALMTQPKIILCDEPVSALDVSIQAQVLNLLLDLQDKEKMSYVFVSHDLSVVRFVAHRIAVMYLGRFVETSSTLDLFTNPKHPYTKMLLSSTPRISKDKMKLKPIKVQGELPSPLNPPSGCAFHTRCPFVQDKCKTTLPELRQIDNSHVACHYVESFS